MDWSYTNYCRSVFVSHAKRFTVNTAMWYTPACPLSSCHASKILCPGLHSSLKVGYFFVFVEIYVSTYVIVGSCAVERDGTSDLIVSPKRNLTSP